MQESRQEAPHEVTRLLDAWNAGERAALDQLMPVVMVDLRRIARAYLRVQAPGLTLQPTALVNEAYLRLIDGRSATWESRLQFFAYTATTMRRILVNYLRDRRAAKRGGLEARVSLEEMYEVPAPGESRREANLLDLDAALHELARLDPRQARIVELRYFGGLSVEETALALEVSPRTVKREWQTARLFLLNSLEAR